MIDTHCHLLPELDDGARSLAEALEMARRFASEGVRTAVCTPHWSREFPTVHDEVLTRFRELSEHLIEADIELDLVAASEVSPVFAVILPAADLRRRSVGDGYVLIDLHATTPASFFEAVTRRLGDAGLTPLFAHPERCRAIQRQPRLLDRPRSMGARVQVVAPSLLGRLGSTVSGAAWALLAGRRADLVASDAHGPRYAGLGEVRGMISRRFGEELADQLLRENPARVVAGSELSSGAGEPWRDRQNDGQNDAPSGATR